MTVESFYFKLVLEAKVLILLYSPLLLLLSKPIHLTLRLDHSCIVFIPCNVWMNNVLWTWVVPSPMFSLVLETPFPPNHYPHLAPSCICKKSKVTSWWLLSNASTEIFRLSYRVFYWSAKFPVTIRISHLYGKRSQDDLTGAGWPRCPFRQGSLHTSSHSLVPACITHSLYLLGSYRLLHWRPLKKKS